MATTYTLNAPMAIVHIPCPSYEHLRCMWLPFKVRIHQRTVAMWGVHTVVLGGHRIWNITRPFWTAVCTPHMATMRWWMRTLNGNVYTLNSYGCGAYGNRIRPEYTPQMATMRVVNAGCKLYPGGYTTHRDTPTHTPTHTPTRARTHVYPSVSNVIVNAVFIFTL